MGDFQRRQVSITEEAYAGLKALAETNKLEVDDLVDHILKSYIDEKLDFGAADEADKRRYHRKRVIIPALVYEQSSTSGVGRYVSTTVLDISIGGAKLALPMERTSRVEFLKNRNNFEVILYLSDTEELSRFKCELKYIEEREQMVSVGGSFLECDEYSSQQLTNYLRQ
ncbi:PilZ domain-containing protein [Desulfonatronovibrio hydrogenovorans]|uniref:PilZ domain-containing protein n=1 Tax=Desulfonatronovibrio hydrogenovorans TaxID=53245 RepID=UPI00048B8967|nr:PilZ domain-containing protein [Desulfonatronovibrio hydrogenovorans]